MEEWRGDIPDEHLILDAAAGVQLEKIDRLVYKMSFRGKSGRSISCPTISSTRGVTALADLPPAELARFTDHVFWLVSQTGIKDPAAWLAAHPDGSFIIYAHTPLDFGQF